MTFSKSAILQLVSLAAAAVAQSKAVRNSPLLSLGVSALDNIASSLGSSETQVTSDEVRAAASEFLTADEVDKHFKAAFDELDALEAEANASKASRAEPPALESAGVDLTSSTDASASGAAGDGATAGGKKQK